jgi:hypothetical protein
MAGFLTFSPLTSTTGAYHYQLSNWLPWLANMPIIPRRWIEELLPDCGFWAKKGTTIFRQLRHLLEKWAAMCVLGSKNAGFGHPTR